MLTSLSDVWAGFAISGAIVGSLRLIIHFSVRPEHLVFLSSAVVLIYAGTMFLGDSYDLHSGTKNEAKHHFPLRSPTSRWIGFLGFLFFALGIYCAYAVRLVDGLIALSIALLSIFYIVYGRYHDLIGPLNIGLIGGGNLLLGISLVPGAIEYNFMVIFVPIVYMTAIYSIGLYDYKQVSRMAIQLTGWLYLFVIIYLMAIAFINHRLWVSLPFIVFLFIQILEPIARAFRSPNPYTVGRSVRQSIVSLIILNAALGAAFSGLITGLFILALLPVSALLSRYFPVT